MALGFGDLVALLGTFAFGTLGAALAPVFGLGLSWPRVTAAAASASILTGMAVSLGLEAIRRLSPTGTLVEVGLAEGTVPSAVALMASFSVLLVVSWVTGRGNSDGMAPEVLAIIESQ